jgi:hypothetical protein
MKRKRDPNWKEDMPIGKLTGIPDFLPPPDQLIFPGDKLAKITLLIDLKSLEFYRQSAKRHHTKYQRLIREVLRRYAAHHDPDKAA